jgi:hypothetical protein
VATADPVGTAIASIGAGAAVGTACTTAGVLALRLLQSGDAAALPADVGGMILSVAVSVGLFAAVLTGWLSSRAIDDTWRRGVTAALAVFGTVLLSVLATPVDLVAGPIGLAAYLVIVIALAVRFLRAARRAAAA